MSVEEFLSTSELIWFKPNKAFFDFFLRPEWRWRKYHDCGAGAGHLTYEMHMKRLDCVAYDMYPRARDQSLAVVEQFDTKDIANKMDISEVVLIARPCHHADFIDVTINSALEMGEAFYIGLAKNFERDLGAFEYDVVEMDVGEGGEDLVRIRCRKDKFHIRRKIVNYIGKKEWWWYKPGRNRYVSEPDGLTGFDGDDTNVKILQEVHWASDLQSLSTKADLCREDSPHGWIAPDGEWFGCGYAEHDYIAREVLGCSVRRLEKLGFCRCHDDTGAGRCWSQGVDFDKRPTPKQKKTLRNKGFVV